MKRFLVVGLLALLFGVVLTAPTGEDNETMPDDEECPDECPEECPEAEGCVAGKKMDRCGCCEECANMEGDLCDMKGEKEVFGACGKHLECRPNVDSAEDGETPDNICFCKSSEDMCGSDGITYSNICQMISAAFHSKTPIKLEHKGPCKAAPFIRTGPEAMKNKTKGDIVLSCEVHGFPIAAVEWLKDGTSLMPGDDMHVAVQARGGPEKYEVTGWLQIQDLRNTDQGTYTCVGKNAYGSAEASAFLEVLPREGETFPEPSEFALADEAPDNWENEWDHDL
ncbi:kazal-type serine protease inhibitor domain-containing protein 1-like [Branchiostoma lanceolatum]|uniref:KAZALD1 protein n=2 Tax=Branchiostoma lanceolatum TaxID=7740 RepID=A0A8K0EQC8_BRALA|nr:KAZALD1 [Branchiostoma lanceolatum]